MEDNYVRLYYLEVKDAQGVYYNGTMNEYASKKYEPNVTENLGFAAFFLDYQTADVTNIHWNNQFVVLEHKINRNIFFKPETPTKKPKHEVRIVKRTNPAGDIMYVIQRKKLYWWFDCVSYSTVQYKTLIEAQQNLCWWDGTQTINEIVYP